METIEKEKHIEEMTNPPFTKASVEHPLWPKIEAALREIYDPEVPINIYELGLFYKIFIDDENNDVTIEMTLTSPACPIAGEMPVMVEEGLRGVEGIGNISVALVWEPMWDASMMAETSKLQLNMF